MTAGPTAGLLAEVAALAPPTEGAQSGPWPGARFYRVTRPTDPPWADTDHLRLVVIAQPAETPARISYAVIGGRQSGRCRLLEASPRRPTLCFVLDLDPGLVRSLSASMPVTGVPDGSPEGYAESVVDDVLADTFLRFLRSLSAVSDRRVLAPLILEEIVYRLLQREQRQQLVSHVARQLMGDPVGAAVGYIRSHFAESLTVGTLAAQVCLSPSAFTRAFRERTGRSPYQYLKVTRLDEARRMLSDERRGVAAVSHAVGYANVSHFIKEFRSRFGTTPGSYGERAGLHRDTPLAARTVCALAV